MNHLDVYKFIQEYSNLELTDKFSAEDMLHLIQYHSHNRDGYLSFTDFNQMVLPTCNSRLRATATQRASLSMYDFDKAKNKKVLQRLVQLLVAEACFNLDLEYLKNRLEVTDGGFSTEQAF